eukprot:gene12692-15924_t
MGCGESGQGVLGVAGVLQAVPQSASLDLGVGNNATLEKAIGVVEKTKSHQLGVLVLDFVNEEKDGSLRPVAHQKLFDTVKQMEDLNIATPSDLMRMLMMLHSYTLVKSLIAIEDHTSAARMLVRVARNISKFPKHVVPILTSTVIECHRACMRKTAFEYASMLMRPEYRNLFIRIVAAERRCPMCSDEVHPDQVRKVNDPLGAIRRKQEATSGLDTKAR